MIRLVFVFLMVNSSIAYSEVSIFRDEFSPKKSTVVFYSDGDVEATFDGIGSNIVSKIKYCNKASGWICAFSNYFVFAMPIDKSIKNWCFGGTRFSLIENVENDRLHFKGSGVDNKSITVVYYKKNKGVTFLHQEKGLDGGFELISKNALFSEEFNSNIKSEAYLTLTESKLLFSLCPESRYKNSILRRDILGVHVRSK